MATQLNMETPISPLDEIRHAEAKVASQILLARQETEERKRSAQKQAKQIIEQAQISGTEAGRAIRQAQVQKTAQTAESIKTAGHHQAQQIEYNGTTQFQQCVRWSVDVVLGMEQNPLALTPTPKKDGSP